MKDRGIKSAPTIRHTPTLGVRAGVVARCAGRGLVGLAGLTVAIAYIWAATPLFDIVPDPVNSAERLVTCGAIVAVAFLIVMIDGVASRLRRDLGQLRARPPWKRVAEWWHLQAAIRRRRRRQRSPEW